MFETYQCLENLPWWETDNFLSVVIWDTGVWKWVTTTSSETELGSPAWGVPGVHHQEEGRQE